ncbi:hypothetical protein EON80_32515 [bacterium]|nr:MAG: hypothetical protein EON80_32515 [bacterium]
MFKPLVALCCLLGCWLAITAPAPAFCAPIDDAAHEALVKQEAEVDALIEEAQALVIDGKLEAARAVYRQIFPIAGDNLRYYHEAVISIAATYLQEQNYEAALAEYQGFAKRKTLDLEHVSLIEGHIGSVYMNMGKYAMARPHFLNVLTIAEEQVPLNPAIIVDNREEATMQMANCFFEEKEYVMAQEWYQRVLKTKGLTTSHKAEAERQLGVIAGLLAKGK